MTTTEELKFTPSSMDKRVSVNGIAVRAGISKNGIKYTAENLQKTAHELNDKPILKDHKAMTDNTIGRTTMAKFESDSISFEGWVKEDGTGITEKIADGRIKEVSIGAMVERLIKENADDEHVIAEGIHYLELSTTPTPGVVGTSIQSFPTTESLPASVTETLQKIRNADDEEELEEQAHKKQEVKNMADESKINEATALMEENKRLKEAINKIEMDNKKVKCEELAKLNPELKVDELMKETEDKLALMKQYEERIIKAKESAKPKGIVQEDITRKATDEKYVFLNGYNVNRQLENVKPGQIVFEDAGGKTLMYAMRDYASMGWGNQKKAVKAIGGN